MEAKTARRRESFTFDFQSPHSLFTQGDSLSKAIPISQQELLNITSCMPPYLPKACIHTQATQLKGKGDLTIYKLLTAQMIAEIYIR